ncbi:hypothetical protein T01_8635, partial [Trichinella spiralis]
MDYTPSRRSPSPSCIGLAAPCNFRPDVALSRTRLGITETIPSLSSNNKMFNLRILPVTRPRYRSAG